jgi:cytochrome b561
MSDEIMRIHVPRDLARAARPTDRHSPWIRMLHWSSVVAIVIAAGTALAWDWSENEELRIAMMTIHRQAGNVVLLALGLRLAARFGIGMEDHAGAMPGWMRLAAQAVHIGLYALILALPLLGLAASNAHAVVVSFLGLFDLPVIVPPDPDLADTLSDLHVWASWFLLLLVSGHVGAALWHHRVRRDGVLLAMLPNLKRR